MLVNIIKAAKAVNDYRFYKLEGSKLSGDNAVSPKLHSINPELNQLIMMMWYFNVYQNTQIVVSNLHQRNMAITEACWPSYLSSSLPMWISCWSVYSIHIRVTFYCVCVARVCVFMASISCGYTLMSLWLLAIVNNRGHWKKKKDLSALLQSVRVIHPCCLLWVTFDVTFSGLRFQDLSIHTTSWVRPPHYDGKVLTPSLHGPTPNTHLFIAGDAVTQRELSDSLT